jgi:multidrug efflux system outer membrane protein
MPTIRPGLPAEVLARRPDVRAAEQDLRANNARIGVAEAAFYPSFSLSASGGFESLQAEDFVNWENRILGLGAGIAAPIFSGGSNQANLAAAISRRDESLARYKNTLLVSLREVEDAATDLKGLARSHTALSAALDAAQDTLQLAKKRFNSGLISFLEVTDAERTVLSIRLELAQTRAQQHITLAAMVKALGGGWSGK